MDMRNSTHLKLKQPNISMVGQGSIPWSFFLTNTYEYKRKDLRSVLCLTTQIYHDQQSVEKRVEKSPLYKNMVVPQPKINVLGSQGQFMFFS